MPRFAGRILLFALMAFVAQVVLTLDYSVAPSPPAGRSLLERARALSVRWPPFNYYRPDSQALFFQRYMRLHPKMGFLFQGDIGRKDTMHVHWADQAPSIIATDENGFDNPSLSLDAKRAGRRIDVIGVGSSFLQGAAGKFREIFWAKGWLYYNMATPRQTLPQFTTAVEEFAVKEKPKWILYDLNETSFGLIQDYEDWTHSGMDWFTFHSGTWCGPARRPVLPIFRRLPALQALYHGIRRRIAPEPPIPIASDEENVRKAMGYIQAAYKTAQANGIRLLVVAIPGKETVLYGKGTSWKPIGDLLPLLAQAGIPVLNLLDTFSTEPDPQALYYKVDAHWNEYGITKAGLAISAFLY